MGQWSDYASVCFDGVFYRKKKGVFITLDRNKIGSDELAGVVGGVRSTANTDPVEKFNELKAAAKKLGKDFTAHRLEAIADKWEENGFSPSAEEFLKDFL